MTGFNTVGRYAEVDTNLMRHSEIHSSFFNQSNYSDIRGTKGMHGTEGTYLFLDFSQSNSSDSIHQDNFARSNYADLKIPLLRRHSSTDRNLPCYAELDFNSKFRTLEDMDTNNSNRYLNIHGKPQTVYSKVRANSTEEVDQNETQNGTNLYAKILPKSQRKSLNNQTIHDTFDTKYIPDQLRSPDVPLRLPDNRRRTLEPRSNKVPITLAASSESIDSPFDRKCEKITSPHKVLVQLSRETTPNRNPPPIRPKPHTAPPVPPHTTRNIPIIPERYHDDTSVRLARKSIHSSTEHLAVMEIGTGHVSCNKLGRSHSFKTPNRVARPDKPPPPPPALKPTFHAFHPNNPIILNRHTQHSNADTKEKLDISIPTNRARSQGDSGIIVTQKENSHTQSNHNHKFRINNIFSTVHKTYKSINSDIHPVTMTNERNAELSHSFGENRDTNKYNFTANTLPKSFMHQNTRPNLPPKPKPRIKPSSESILCQGYIWKQNPRTGEWSQWFAILEFCTLKLYQSKEERPWLTVPTSNLKEINTFFFEGLESQLAFSLVTTMKSYIFSSKSIDETKKWVNSLSTLIT